MNHPSRAHTASAPQPQRLRVLALHSFRTSGAIFKQQMERAKMLERLDDLVDIVFIDAPNSASGIIPRDVAPFFAGPYYEWFTVERMGDKYEFDEVKLARSLDVIGRTLREQGPFDGLVGFSQGTACASTLVALQRAGMALQDVPPLRFCILFAGFKSRYAPHAPAWQAPVAVPSLHIFGDRDELRDKCKDLVDAFQNPVVLQHTRGHSIPNLEPHQLSVMRAFLSSFKPTTGLSTGLNRQPTRHAVPQPADTTGAEEGAESAATSRL